MLILYRSNIATDDEYEYEYEYEYEKGDWKWRKGKMEVCVNVWGAVVAWKAMKAHTSQFVWYRKVFVWLSSYSYINILEYVCER
jgi:hypothetical protein